MYLFTQNHKKHLIKVASIKSSIDNKSPWKPRYSLSKMKNKYDRGNLKIIQSKEQTLTWRIKVY